MLLWTRLPPTRQIEPVDIIVLPDGVPTDDPTTVIQAAARKLEEGLHHPNAVGIQFVQIGDDEGQTRPYSRTCVIVVHTYHTEYD